MDKKDSFNIGQTSVFWASASRSLPPLDKIIKKKFQNNIAITRYFILRFAPPVSVLCRLQITRYKEESWNVEQINEWC